MPADQTVRLPSFFRSNIWRFVPLGVLVVGAFLYFIFPAKEPTVSSKLYNNLKNSYETDISTHAKKIGDLEAELARLSKKPVPHTDGITFYLDGHELSKIPDSIVFNEGSRHSFEGNNIGKGLVGVEVNIESSGIRFYDDHFYRPIWNTSTPSVKVNLGTLQVRGCPQGSFSATFTLTASNLTQPIVKSYKGKCP